jgi:hypothetical protein
MVDDGAFLEHARVFDNCLRHRRAQVEGLLAEGRGVVLEIDWQGARQVRAAMPASVGIFILPPSRDELERRLRGRATDSEAVIRGDWRTPSPTCPTGRSSTTWWSTTTLPPPSKPCPTSSAGGARPAAPDRTELEGLTTALLA